MLSDKPVAIVLAALSSFLFPGIACSNTLSETYSLAFVEPYKFEGLLRFKAKDDSLYYKRFATCYNQAIPNLNAMEKDLRAKHGSCQNNSECGQIATDIKTVVNLREKVGDLERYVRATQKAPWPNFLDSNIGLMARQVFDFHQNNGIDIRKNPELIREIGTLHAIPCP